MCGKTAPNALEVGSRERREEVRDVGPEGVRHGLPREAVQLTAENMTRHCRSIMDANTAWPTSTGAPDAARSDTRRSMPRTVSHSNGLSASPSIP